MLLLKSFLKLSTRQLRRSYSSKSSDPIKELEKFPSVITLPIHWGQQDPFRHLNNVDWLRFIETGRIDYMYLLTLSMGQDEVKELLTGTGEGFIVKSQECKYRLPITFPDTLTVATKIENLTKDRFTFHTLTYSNRHSKIASESNVVCVSYNHPKLCKSNFTESFVKAVINLEKTPLETQTAAKSLPLRKYIGGQ